MDAELAKRLLIAWLQKQWPGCCDGWVKGGPTYCYTCMCPPEAHALKVLLKTVEHADAYAASIMERAVAAEQEVTNLQQALRFFSESK